MKLLFWLNCLCACIWSINFAASPSMEEALIVLLHLNVATLNLALEQA